MARLRAAACGRSRVHRRGRAPHALLLRRSRGQRRKGVAVRIPDRLHAAPDPAGSLRAARRCGGRRGRNLSLSAADAVAGVEDILYRLDNGAEQAYEKPARARRAAEGPHQIQFYAGDRVGNREAPQASPSGRSHPAADRAVHPWPAVPDKGVRYISPQAEIELAGRDAVAGSTPIRYRIDDATTGTLYTAPFHLPQTVGIHRLRIESSDPVNNSAQLNVDDIYMDPVPPRTEIQFSRPYFLGDHEVVPNPASKIALNASDFESGVDW